MPKTIKELAQDMNCSYEAVRQQVKRYRHDLSGHISYIGPAQTLDDYACAFLLQKRKESPIAIVNVDRNDRMRELEEDLRAAKDTIIMLQGEQNKRLEAENSEIKRLIAENAQQRERLALIEERAQKVVQEAVAAARRAVTEEKDQEIAQIRQEASEVARRAAENEKILEGFIQDAKTELTLAQEDAQAKLDEKDAIIQEQEKEIQDLKNRSRWQRFLDVFK